MDKGNAIVNVMIPVLCARATSNIKLFVVNMYNTSSRLLINGKSPDIFKTHFYDFINNLVIGDNASGVNSKLLCPKRNTCMKEWSR